MGEKAEVVTAARDARRVTNFIVARISISRIKNPSQTPNQAKLKVEGERQKEDGHLKMLRQVIDNESLTGAQCA